MDEQPDLGPGASLPGVDGGGLEAARLTGERYATWPP